ncbi:TPA: tRNA-specific adenosine deaminase [bacterium]|nr:tRNA-specific adenosine deaminase [bacterium]
MNDEFFMEKVLIEAEKSKDDVPIGCVVVLDGEILAKGHNEVEKKDDPTLHAEILALRKAIKKVGRRKIQDAELYVNLEPCSMCVSTMIIARIKRLIFGAFNEKMGACGSVVDLRDRFCRRIEVKSGVLKDRCEELLKEFFRGIRRV